MKKELQRHGKAKIPGAPVPYDRTKIHPGILHIGVGNFHRAHEEFYTNQLLGMGGREEWGIYGVALLPQDEPLYKALKRPGRSLYADGLRARRQGRVLRNRFAGGFGMGAGESPKRD